MHKTAEFLRSCGAFYLAAVDGGRHRVRPFGALDEFEGKLCFRRAGNLELCCKGRKSNKRNRWGFTPGPTRGMIPLNPHLAK